LRFLFGDHILDTARRELRGGGEQIALEPQVFDLLVYLLQNRERVVSKDDLLASVWGGRIVSDATLDSRIAAARRAVGDSGAEQSLIRTTPRKGVRFIGVVREEDKPPEPIDAPMAVLEDAQAASRRLAAILAADVAGYSRLMGKDEEGTHERLQAHLRELVNPKIADHRGRVVKNTGDGFLAEFASVVDAVRCAVEVQRGMVERNAAIPSEKRIEFRIGINLGMSLPRTATSSATG
jgi:DNA-binding winged helix-turn-helix (wHTH) protein